MDIVAIIDSLSVRAKKFIATTVMFFIGLILFTTGLSMFPSGFGFFVFILGLCLSIVGIAPLFIWWIDWQFIREDKD